MKTETTEPAAPEGSKGARYREQVLDESFFGDQVPVFADDELLALAVWVSRHRH